MNTALTSAGPDARCTSCPIYQRSALKKLGTTMAPGARVVALAGNPNTGKTTVFNVLTGSRQHTGNWPGKTVARAEGAFAFHDQAYRLVDLPGTYSLLAGSPEEEIARDFLLFGRPDVTVIVADAGRLERNLNLVLQVLEITDRAVLALNLMDEAARHGLEVDARRLARDVGIPVIPLVARSGRGLPELLQAIEDVATGRQPTRPQRATLAEPALDAPLAELGAKLSALVPGLPNPRWVAIRLLGGDPAVATALREGRLGAGPGAAAGKVELQGVAEVLAAADRLRRAAGYFNEHLAEGLYAEAGRLAARCVSREGATRKRDWDEAIDRVLVSRTWGFPVMALLLTGVFWLTITGANIPSRWIAAVLIDTIYPQLGRLAVALHWPAWLSGVTIDGMYLAAAWIVSVMLPPMAIFFPLFTLLEDLGYLPRVAFNLDGLFERAGAHGKQALSMVMGFGCNAAGVVATRIIDSPRERLIAILTNNFSLCNGRWPTQILVATLFVGALVPGRWASLTAALTVLAVAVLGVGLGFVVSWGLSRTVLRGERSVFSLELPPYRPPRFWSTLYTSLIDRTVVVLWRAVVFALPAGAVIWLIANVSVAGQPFAARAIQWLDPAGWLLGLNGIVLLAYVVAIPANEIVIPTILMLTALTTGAAAGGHGAGVLFQPGSSTELLSLLHAGGWTLLTAVNLMLFSLIHNPCSTTLYTIYRETRSVKWTVLSAALPLGLGGMVTLVVAGVWRLLVGG